MLCLCVGERVSEGAHPCGVSGERSLIQLYSAEDITGAISSAALPLISLIIILLTYCTAICILRLDRSHCKLRTSFSAVPCFPSPGPHPPRCGFPVLSHIQDATHTQYGVMCPICTVKTIKIINLSLVYNAVLIPELFLTFNYPQMAGWYGWALMMVSGITLLPHTSLLFTIGQLHWSICDWVLCLRTPWPRKI